MELELIENEKGLVYDPEYYLSREPLQIDLLVIKKKPEEVIKNEIGSFFLGHNIVEYKSPDDSMNIDTFYKVLSYAFCTRQIQVQWMRFWIQISQCPSFVNRNL